MIDRERTITLTEYEPCFLAKDEIAEDVANAIWKEYGGKLEIEFPNPKTEGRWCLLSEGWVGHVSFDDGLNLAIEPKLPVSNVFRMLEYAYRLSSFKFLEGGYRADSLDDFYDELASILAKRILSRGRKGFYREYVELQDQLPFLSGRLRMEETIRTPWKVYPHCQFQEHTPDIVENQLLAWTLFAIARSGQCSHRVAPTIRRAYRDIQGFVELIPFSPEECVGRLYNRLNEDYQELHALCRFFLENSGPTHLIGEKRMIPFLINMADLFELFVAEWMRLNLPDQYMLKAQERVEISESRGLHFAIDMVIDDLEAGEARFVLDTKYKAPDSPSAADLQQIIAYAQVKGCHEAILIYPKQLETALDYDAKDIRVRTMVFDLAGDLEHAGRKFLASLLGQES